MCNTKSVNGKSTYASEQRVDYSNVVLTGYLLENMTIKIEHV